jgi:hypothetical protein
MLSANTEKGLNNFLARLRSQFRNVFSLIFSFSAA